MYAHLTTNNFDLPEPVRAEARLAGDEMQVCVFLDKVYFSFTPIEAERFAVALASAAIDAQRKQYRLDAIAEAEAEEASV